MHGPQKLEVVDIQSKQVTVRWEPLGYNVTRCHSYNLTVQYRSRVAGKEETREEVCYDTQSRDPQHTIHNLTPYTNLSVKLVLRNLEGVKESTELEVQTDEDGECDMGRMIQVAVKLILDQFKLYYSVLINIYYCLETSYRFSLVWLIIDDIYIGEHTYLQLHCNVS